MYPLFLDLRDRAVLVVGGGRVAGRRLVALVAQGAQVTVVAPDVTEEIRAAAQGGSVRWLPRAFSDGDVSGVWLVVSCAGRDVDAAVARSCHERRIWCVDSSTAQSSAAWTGTSVEAPDGIQVAVSGGGDPRRAQHVRQVVAAALSTADLRRRRPGRGRVVLVGAGPGDPELMTVRAMKVLAAADVLVADRLAPREVVDSFQGTVIHVGKEPGNHPVAQAEINRILVEQAASGQVVVRLKGGDPFVLGRGGEELAACLDAGIDVEVVPGITSAVAVPAGAGIPVTSRGLASGFLVASAHGEDEGFIARLAATPPEITLVLLMGVRQLGAVVAALLAAGRDPSTPAAIVERGWTPQQRTVSATLADLPARAETEAVRSPSTVVIGAVAGLRETFGDLAVPSPGAGLVAD